MSVIYVAISQGCVNGCAEDPLSALEQGVASLRRTVTQGEPWRPEDVYRAAVDLRLVRIDCPGVESGALAAFVATLTDQEINLPAQRVH